MEGSIPIKTQEEIEALRYAGRILKEALESMAAAAKPGMSTWDLDQIAEKVISKYEGAKPGFKGHHGFPAAVCTSVNEEVVHGIPSKDLILQEGDIVGVDCGVLYKEMHTDACVTILIGDVAPEIRHFVKTTKKALSNAVKLVRPGARIGDISAVIQKTLEDQGYDAVLECTGHGVGKNLHEPPEILNKGSKGSGPVIKSGMVLAIEPIAAMESGAVVTAPDGWTVETVDGSISAHYEHTVLVTENGYEILT